MKINDLLNVETQKISNCQYLFY